MGEYLLIQPLLYGDYSIGLYQHSDNTSSRFDRDYFVPGLPAAQAAVEALNHRRVHAGLAPYPIFIWDIGTNREKPFTSNT